MRRNSEDSVRSELQSTYMTYFNEDGDNNQNNGDDNNKKNRDAAPQNWLSIHGNMLVAIMNISDMAFKKHQKFLEALSRM